jgi:lactate 2-monooxygenase
MRINYGGFGAERQNELYVAGIMGRTPSVPISPERLEAMAKMQLSPEAFDYVAGGAGSEDTLRENLEAFRKWRLVPRMLVRVDVRDTSTELLGKRLPAPFLLAPTGVLSIVHKDGELGAARAAASLGLPFILSTAASYSIEEVAQANADGVRWFQLYWSKDREVNMSLVSRAESSGYSAIVVTLDTKIVGWRERDLQRGYFPFLKGDGTANYLSDPVFRSKLDKSPESDLQGAILRSIGLALDPAFNWEDVKYLRGHTRLPILLKGILNVEDARRATETGVDGIIVSNHGGRQVDGGIAALSALRAVVKSVGDQLPVLFDSGIRRGADALKAMALGAKAVLIGRPYVWGLAIGGENGVKEVLLNLLADFDLTMALCGIKSIDEINIQLLISS